MKKLHIAAILIALLALCSCSEQPADEAAPTPVSDAPVTFGIKAVDTRSGHQGEMNLDVLKATGVGFGVYGYYTGTDTWATAATGSTVPDFMYNQYVECNDVPTGEYDLAGNALSVEQWTYDPVKYWPNGEGTANDETGTGLTPHHVSFFAYAPHVDLDITDLSVKNDPTTDPTSGIIAINGSAMPAKGGLRAPTVDYKLSTTSANVDLLWATPQKDLAKQKVAERVDFTFHHALASLCVMVQRVYDEPLPGTGLHPDNDADTKLFVSSLTLSGRFHTEGRLRLDDGTWTDLSDATFSPSAQPTAAFSFGSNDINTLISGTLSAETSIIQDAELDKWGRKWTDNGGALTLDENGSILPGVTEEPRLLHRNTSGILFIPQSGVSLTPTLTYSFVTRDDALELDYLEDSGIGFDRPTVHRYSRITMNATGDPIDLGTLEGGKRYVLLCLIGVEHVSFQVVSVEDWDFPMRYTTGVSAYVDGYAADPASGGTSKTLDEE